MPAWQSKSKPDGALFRDSGCSSQPKAVPGFWEKVLEANGGVVQQSLHVEAYRVECSQVLVIGI